MLFSQKHPVIIGQNLRQLISQRMPVPAAEADSIDYQRTKIMTGAFGPGIIPPELIRIIQNVCFYAFVMVHR